MSDFSTRRGLLVTIAAAPIALMPMAAMATSSNMSELDAAIANWRVAMGDLERRLADYNNAEGEYFDREPDANKSRLRELLNVDALEARSVEAQEVESVAFRAVMAIPATSLDMTCKKIGLLEETGRRDNLNRNEVDALFADVRRLAAHGAA